jgi:phosphoribosyl 1,2-cyclic phosphodiesterase
MNTKNITITFYGTRGSLPIARADSVNTGGNTTCLLVESQCIPEWMAVVLDAGSGLKPASAQILKRRPREVHIFQSHYHHDHTQGMLIAPIIYIPNITTHVWGPVEKGVGPRRAYAHIMQKPWHPVPFEAVASHFEEHPIKDPAAEVIIVHPKGGIIKVTKEKFERTCSNGKQFKFGGESYHVDECLVVKMYITYHPERTISYRLEERPTGKVFVFLTDNENTDGFPASLLAHVKGADLVAHDTQYGRERYVANAVGWGHGTPDYVVELAMRGGVKKLGFTHHEPDNSDAQVEALFNEGLTAFETLSGGGKVSPEGLALTKDNILICKDYLVVEL